MRFHQFGVLLVFALCCFPTAQAQQDSIDYRECIRTLVEMVEDNEGQEQMGERLLELAQHPIDLNTATHEDLAQIPFFDDFFIRNLLLFRSQHSGLSSVYDLKMIQGAPTAVLPLLEPFFTLSDRPRAPKPRTHSVFMGTEVELGGRSVSYPHTASLLLRYESVGPVSWHVAIENDRGEPFGTLRKGFTDYQSIAVYSNKRVGIHQLSYVLGDFRVNSGQGLLLGQSFSYFSSLASGTGVPTLSRVALKPHRSFREYGFLRGGAAHLHMRNGIGLLLFGGYENIDARIEGRQLKTIYSNTLHRTTSERMHRHTATREALGGYLSYDTQDFHVGISTLHYRHRGNGQLLLPPERYPQSKIIGLWSADASYTGKHWQAFVESLLNTGERAGIQGGVRYVEDHFGSLTLQGRYFGTQQISPYGIADTYTSTSRDEKGIRLMWHGELAYWTTATIIIDHFDKLSTSDKTNTIVSARVLYAKGQTNLQGYLRFHHRENGDDRLTLRTVMKKTLTPAFALRYGAQLNYTKDAPLGYTLFSRATIGNPQSIRSEVGGQYFRAGKGVIRSDMPYMPYHYYSPFLRGKGLLLNGVIRYPLSPHVKVEARVSHTIYSKGVASTTSHNPSLLFVTLSIKV